MSRVLVPLLSAVVLLSPAARADDDAKAVIARAVKAHGGEEVLAKYQAGQAKNKGKITLPGLGDAEFTQQTAFMFPGKFRESLELAVAGQTVKVETRVNGDKVTIEANGNEVPQNDTIKAAMKDVQYVMKVARLTALLKEKGFELSSAGEAKVNDAPAVGVRVSMKDQKDVTLYFDKKTNLLAKLEFRTTDPMTGNELTEERIIQEYQKSGEGLPAPKKIVVKRDGKDYITAEVLEFKFLEKLDDSEFTK
jgi:hypothetical protein